MGIAHTWTECLGDEDLEFARQFIMASGSLKEMASRYGVSYPTIRLRLDRLIQKIESSREDDDAFVSLVKGMAIDDRMDFGEIVLRIGLPIVTTGCRPKDIYLFSIP